MSAFQRIVEMAIEKPQSSARREWERRFFEHKKTNKNCCASGLKGALCYQCLTCAINILVPIGKAPCEECQKSKETFKNAEIIILSFGSDDTPNPRRNA